MPVSSHNSAAHSHFVSAMAGNTNSILLPSMETEFTRPGLLHRLIASTQISALGLSTAMGVSVASWTMSISQAMVSISTDTSVEAHTSMKLAPASVWDLARFLMNSASRFWMASATDGMAPLIFSPIMIIIASPVVNRKNLVC